MKRYPLILLFLCLKVLALDTEALLNSGCPQALIEAAKTVAEPIEVDTTEEKWEELYGLLRHPEITGDPDVHRRMRWLLRTRIQEQRMLDEAKLLLKKYWPLIEAVAHRRAMAESGKRVFNDEDLELNLPETLSRGPNRLELSASFYSDEWNGPSPEVLHSLGKTFGNIGLGNVDGMALLEDILNIRVQQLLDDTGSLKHQ